MTEQFFESTFPGLAGRLLGVVVDNMQCVDCCDATLRQSWVGVSVCLSIQLTVYDWHDRNHFLL